MRRRAPLGTAQVLEASQLAAAAAEEYSCEFGSTKFYALCALGGVLSCGITHTAVTPLDLVKCRLQVCSTATSYLLPL